MISAELSAQFRAEDGIAGDEFRDRYYQEIGREEEAARNDAFERHLQRVAEVTPVLKPAEVTSPFLNFPKRFRAA
jgi:hypothetical protein